MTQSVTGSGKSPVFVVGGGLLALGIVRAMGQLGIPAVVFSNAEEQLLRRSRYCRVVAVPGGDESTLAAILNECELAVSPPVLIPAGDRGLIFCCKHYSTLESAARAVLPSAEAARTVVEKDLFDSYAHLHGVPVPRSWAFAEFADMQREAPHLPYPLAVKPAMSTHWHGPAFSSAFGHIKMLRADSAEQLLAYAAKLAPLAPVPLLQEFVVGGDHEHYSYVSYRNRDGEELAGTLIQKLRLNPIRYGLGTCARVVRDEVMERIGRHVTATLPYRSVASVCFKRDVRTGDPKVFEVNGRLPLNFPAIALGGVNLPWLMYRDALGERPAPEIVQHTGRLWTTLSHDMWAANQYRKAGELSLAQWIWSYRNVNEVLEFNWRDPGPGLAFAADAARMACRRITRNW